MNADSPMPCDRCGQAHARCSAHRRDGLPCTQRPMHGQRVCKMHGGKTPGAVEKAERRRQEEAAGRVLAKVWDPGAAPVVDVVTELQRLAGQMRHAVDVLGSMLGDNHEPCPECGRVDVDLDSAPGVAWLRQQRELRQLLVAMEGLNLEQRAVQVESRRQDLMVFAIGRVFEVLGLDEEQRVTGGRVLLEELRARDAGRAVVGGEVAS